MNGEAIYQTSPWLVCQNETKSNVFYTIQPKTKVLYAIFTKWPKDSLLQLNCPIAIPNETKIRFVGLNDDDQLLEYKMLSTTNQNDNIQYSMNDFEMKGKIGTSRAVLEQKQKTQQQGGIEIELPYLTPDVIPCNHAWVLAISPIANLIVTD